ncbi:CCT-beta [Plasmodiophora brassicae]|uniref:CCT-beta n=1 Tax=Plasmodiophora brassicae TaxID=37360 RepID=A0A0G4IQP1_PLABS|nr:hypothetical protein PBRA_000834 [Plasmodiophora brassicae]SPQ97799.1 unnamed protein product [Plasmodiophora brassicae]
MARVLPRIFNEEGGAQEDSGENARLSSFVGSLAIADLIKTTLGPKGMDKILLSTGEGPASGKVTITNDGATILKSLPIDNAAAKILVDISKTQDTNVGDGTTSVVVLAGALIREAERLIEMKIHPQTIIRGWRKAITTARAALEASAVNHADNAEQFREDLLNIAKTTISSKILTQNKEKFAEIAVDAVMRLKGSTNLDNIQIIKKKGAQLKDSYLEPGFILDKKFGVGQSKRIEKARILLANTPMDTDKIKIYGARVRVDSMDKVAEIEKAEKAKMKQKVDKILKHDINVFINRQLIYNYPEHLLGDAGVTTIEHADFEGIERLALVLDAEIVSTFDHPEKVRLGTCDRIEEIMIGEDKVILFSGVPKGEACTVVLRGASDHLLDEAERSLHDALCVLSQTVNESRTVLGGGCSEMRMANAVDELATKTPGKEALAIEAFSRALRTIPTVLADNAGYDSSELVSQLRAAHKSGFATAGLDMERGQIGDVRALRIIESFIVKNHVVVSAHEAAEMIIRVDDIIKCAPRPRQPSHH